ncbi:serine/threonine-protein kinase [Microcoleus sp. FACHB-68]|uniref:serine/threonine protein kinase n=1 Tax=Microcoleus sp. FACHB-68 TaxID=2692826 RepID=UPI001684516E|nr:serine/threonine-protein kinase [Microcoleus sp. FACHB-68]MBD1939635.1 serine/threonine protein kinase [Microcoleus sp. FACHB-68]
MLKLCSVLQNRYQLKHQLSDHPVRQTWLAEDLESQDQVVVKLLAFGGQMQWDDLKLFEREAKVLQQLNHPQIPKYRDYFAVDESNLWFGLVQEYIPGSSLKQLLEEGQQFSEQQVRQIAQDVLEILIYLHELKPPVIHRDIKPSNLILGADDRVYLVDFGAVQNRPSATGATFTVVGTYGYTPLEQYGGQTVPASDLYALGATLIHLLTGTAPAELPQRDLRVQWSDRITSNVSGNFVRWVDQLIQPAVERRFPSAVRARDALKGALTIPWAIAEVPAVADTCAIVNHSPERLEIEIPARVEVEVIEPVKKVLNRGLEAVQSSLNTVFSQLQDSAGSIPKQAILLRAGVVGGALVLLSFAFPVIIYTMQFLNLLIPALMLLAIFILLGSWRVYPRSYFERTYVCFELDNFVMEWQQVWLYNYRRETGVTSEIQDVSVATYGESNDCESNSPHSAVVITAGPSQNEWEKYIFGQELSEAELIKLTNEIRAWLAGESQ